MNDAEWVEVMKKDYREAEMSDADRAMLDYVTTLTLTPAKTTEDQILRLREVGFGDKAILEINQIAGFFAWCNRTVDGLGVDLEEFWRIEGATNV